MDAHEVDQVYGDTTPYDSSLGVWSFAAVVYEVLSGEILARRAGSGAPLFRQLGLPQQHRRLGLPAHLHGREALRRRLRQFRVSLARVRLGLPRLVLPRVVCQTRRAIHVGQ